jgi:hypothetical protein
VQIFLHNIFQIIKEEEHMDIVTTRLEHRVYKYYGKLHIFRNESNWAIKFAVRSYKRGTLVIDCFKYEHYDIWDLAETLAGMFSEYSNASSIISKYLLYKEKVESIREIIVVAFNVEVTRAYPFSSKAEIACGYNKVQHTLKEKCTKTPEYREYMSQIGKEKVRKERISKLVKSICDTTRFAFRDEKLAYADEFLKNLEPGGIYNITTAKFAMRWAKLMQHQMEKKNHPGEISKIAEQLAWDANLESNDTAIMISYYDGGISDKYLFAIAFLSKFWAYGEELRLWHNRKYGYDGEGLFNPYYEEDSEDDENSEE